MTGVQTCALPICEKPKAKKPKGKNGKGEGEEEVLEEKEYESLEEAKKNGGGKYRDKNGKLQELKLGEDGKWTNKFLKQTAPELKPAVAEEGRLAKFFKGAKEIGGKALRGAGRAVGAVGEAAVTVASKIATPVLAAYACWEAYEKISALDPLDPDYKKNIVKVIADLIARYGVVTVAKIGRAHV